MGYAFHAWSLDVQALRTACATRATQSVVATAYASAIQRYNTSFASEIEAGAPRLDQALGRLIEGQGGYGAAQAYALELVCRHVGRWLDNDGLDAIGWAWVERVDAALADAGVEFRLRDLHEAPVRLPDIPDFPMVGYALRDQLAPLADLPRQSHPGLERAFASLRGWAKAETDVVTFYY